MFCSKTMITVTLCFFDLLQPSAAIYNKEKDIVRVWAIALGEDLWNLSQSLVNSDHVRSRYKSMNASVKQKDGKQILESSLRSVSTMLTRKINAVKCIHATAERLAQEFDYTQLNDKDNLNFTYCSAKYSNFKKEDGTDVPLGDLPKFAQNNKDYLNVSLEQDSHFYDINVNTSLSCVHVPTNIFYKENDALGAILWSKSLDETFLKNYQSDPSLSWQYFGSSHGVMRFYPAMSWNTKKVDTYDCRVRSWYIEAATCSKDMIVLFDVSGSMTGFKNYVARRTLRTILETLSNNDYVNVFTFKKETNTSIIYCFTDLVQATPENVITIINFLEPTDNGKKHNIVLEGNGNLTEAYMKAFTTLKERRKEKNCDVSSTQGCNQLVMLITDYVPGNLTEVFEEYNRETVDNNTFIPVRVFTYLIGKEVSNVLEIQSMACNNRGYYVHIHSVEEVQQQVLKYINVIARPMILEREDPPPTWTHANIDETRTTKWGVSSDVSRPDEDKLVTSVAIPAFDYKYNEEQNDAILLGVAGTDVPIDSIAKLAKPHQLGVNGYSFIVSNNGYLLLHPLLITSINGKLQENYNSVDFVEVEQVDDGKGPRELGEEIKELRQRLVNASDGFKENIKVLYHYDDMRRIARVKHDYFFNKLEGTPFSMGISLPKGYGDTELLLRDNPIEVIAGQELTGINVTQYFNFTFRVHPDWVYCKYHYLEGHESDNAEIEIFRFLANISKNEVDITKQQYAEDMDAVKFTVESHCGNATTKGKDEYYCNDDLVKQLVFDAKLSDEFFRKWNADEEARDKARKYNVSVRFIATSSGLTRWDYIFDEDRNEIVDEFGNRNKKYEGKVFGDYFHNTIEETWYKAAVLQHMTNKDTLVVATPLPVLDESIKNPPKVTNADGDITITASYAIFYKDGDSETPASVIGFQFPYRSYREIFFEITRDKDIKCSDNSHECYLIDSSGYVVMAKDQENVGKFFGVVEPLVFRSFVVDENIYDQVEVFNYQALCPLPDTPTNNDSRTLFTPLSFFSNIIKYLLAELLLLVTDVYNWNEYAYAAVLETQDDSVPEHYDDEMNNSTETNSTTPPETETIIVNEDKEEQTFSCDHRITLFILNQTLLMGRTADPVIYVNNTGQCDTPYYAVAVTRTNLLLVIVPKHSHTTCEQTFNTIPKPTYDSTKSKFPCHKLELGKLPRRQLEGCYTYHGDERNITACGRGEITVSGHIQTLALPLAVVLFAINSL